MSTVKELELNKRYSWDEIVDAYPDTWVFLVDPEYDDRGAILYGILVAKCLYKDREATVVSLIKQNIDYIMLRTTFNELSLGVLHFGIPIRLID